MTLSDRIHDLTCRLMARCRVCGSSTRVYCYDPRSLLHYFWRDTWCPEHCPGHDFQYERSERDWLCSHCNESAPWDHYVRHPDE